MVGATVPHALATLQAPHGESQGLREARLAEVLRPQHPLCIEQLTYLRDTNGGWGASDWF